jgi:two-component system, chemotaxis family, response regulator WspF
MRVAIVNDSKVVVEVLREVVLSDPRHDIAWVAEDGDEAARRCREDTPDVILMDLIMPRVNGAEATRLIMRQSPCAVLVVTAGVGKNFQLVCEALGHGAYDAVATPVLGGRPPAEAGAELLAKLEAVDRVNRRLRPDAAGPAPEAQPAPRRPQAGKAVPLVALGTSTGGPLALAAALGALPADFPAAVLLVQHLDPEYVPSLADWLQARTRLAVRIARGGERPQPGVALLACSRDHLVLTAGGTLAYTAEPADYPYRPSVDELFESLAAHWPAPGVAALLTGIGRDGASGLLALRRARWQTAAEHQSTAVVYGMPKAAVELGAAEHVLPLQEVGPFLARAVANLERGHP